MDLEELRGPHDVDVERDVAMRTRDGKRLYADVYRPRGEGSLPTLLRRTPYGKHLNDLAAPFNEAHYYASHGYLTVVQNTRGRFGSEGAWYPFVYEARDGYDAIEWAAALPSSNGRVGTFGQSYGALSQYLAATQRPPHLVTAVPVSAYLGEFRNYWYNHGALELSWTLSYFMNMAQDVLAAKGDTARLAALQAMQVDPSVRFSPLTDEALRHLPLRDWIDRFGDGAPFLADILHHDTDGPYWWAVDLRRRLQDIDVPMLHVGSWYDIANFDTPQYFLGLSQSAMSARSRADQALFMGPWAHLLPYNQPTSGDTGDIDFGPEAAYPVLQMQRQWFDHFVRDGRTGLPRPRVTLFVMGENRWRDEEEWPPSRAEVVPWHLRGSGPATTADGAGVLGPDLPEPDEAPDTYVYDPDDPVPTAGGRYVGGGVADQRATQAREDVLVYTGPVAANPLEITGEIAVRLFVSTDVPDTDFVAVLSDVHPTGFVQNLAEGVVRMRFRDSYDEPSPIVEGRVYEIRVELGHLSHVVLPEHRLRLHLTSSDFPRWDRNPNTGRRVADATSVRKATQVVHHDAEHPSALLLPVVPR
ncbi:CocE/NonD family hydrolase [Pseudonocardia lutea]|uniref:CocE/NonD family hydrolase n=1 Tax=Pseudonocardia lutea TaxID=2172015 RepID=A0ABW1IE00_9PSEU